MMSLIDQYVSQAKDHVRGRKLRRQHQHGHLLVQTPAEPPAVDLSAYTDEMVLCHCQRVTFGQIKAAVADGCAPVEQVMTLTDLGQACGCCVGQTWPVIEELLAAK